MADFLGVEKQQEQQPQQTTDFLGAKVPIAFSSQPSLPAAGPGAGAGGGASAAPPTIAGSGVAAPAPGAPEGFGQLATAALGPEGGGGEAGGSPGAPGGLGQGFSGGLLGSLTPPDSPIGISPFGSLSLNTGNPKFDAAVNTLGKTVLGQFGAATSIPGIISMLSNSTVAGLVSSALGAIGAPFTFINAVHLLSQLSPTTTTSLQSTIAGLGGRANNPDPFGNISPEDIEAVLSQLSPAELSAIAAGKHLGPAVDTPMTQGTMGWSPVNTATAPRPNDPNDPTATAPTATATTSAQEAADAAAANAPSPTADAPAAADTGTSPDW